MTTMKAAIYARKSNDDSDRHRDNKSVTRQVDHARAYAKAKGWTVDDAHIYVDDGISGASYEKRVSFHRLEAAAKRGEFAVIVASEPSRLGRSGLADVQRLTAILESGVRILYYLDDKEEKCDTFEGELSLTMQALFAKQERLRTAQRSRDGCARKAEAGYNAGGRVYGYDNHQVWTKNAHGDPVRSHTEYRINEQEARVIRAICRAYVDGYGVKLIAKALNGDPRYADVSKRYFGGATPPSPWKGTGSWAPSLVHAILRNVRYTGVIPYGKYRKAKRGGKDVRIKQADYLKVEAPHLRIVPAELWEEVRKRQAAAQKTYLKGTRGQRFGRRGPGTESKYLLTNLARCGRCTANITAVGGKTGSGEDWRRIYYYGCSFHHNRGRTVCANDHRARMEAANAAVLEAIERKVLNPEAVSYTIEKALALLATRRRANPDRPRAIDAELRRLARELRNLGALAANGKAPRTILEEIAAREARIAELERERDEYRVEELSELDLRKLRNRARERMGELKDLIYGDVPLARRALRELLVEPGFRFDPVMQAGRKAYRFEGKARAGALLTGYIGMASPAGVEPALPP